jgi:hypothetical protein
MPNIEDKLKSIRLRGLDGNERDAAWRVILLRKNASNSVLSFNFALKPMTALIIALAVLFSGSGVVIASDAAKPGDALFGIDLAVERVRMSLSGDDNRNELARTFAQERLQEIQKLRGDGSVDDDGASSTQSTAGLTEAEAEIFTDETVVKLEINDRKVGFLTQSKTREAIVTEISAQYDIEKLIVEAKLVVTTEDRASRPEDREFLNSDTRAGEDISLDDDEKRDIQVGLDQVLKALGEDSASSSVGLRAALQGILDSSATGKIKIESDGQKVEFKFKDGSIEMKVKSEDGSDDSSDDDSDEDRSGSDDDSDDRFRVRLSGSASSSDDDSDGDLFDDSDNRSASSSDDDSDDDSRSGSGHDSDDDSDDDSDEDSNDDSDDDKSGSGKDSDDDKDDEDED